ncbi:MAG: helix-turn-helix transcriptional regulator [Colwellia sp.]|nr:helix-turn-helix transcriptional regulator [Colwellia sp.]
MNQEMIIKLRHKAEEANISMVSLIDEVERKLTNPRDAIPLVNFQEVSFLIKKRRKDLGITLEDLELQTDLSISTLKRLMSDPAGARFSNVIIVLKELGVESWAEL